MKNKIMTLIAAAILVGPMVSIAAPVTITFEEFAADNSNGPMPATRYSAVGVSFAATDDGTTWGGLGVGDPGNWGLAGTNGSTFMGFNGSSYGLTMNFTSSITGFSLDAARSNGSSAGNSLTVTGYLGASLVDSITIGFGAINSWSTFALTGSVDSVVIQGAGSGFHPFGVDNITWMTGATVPEPGILALFGLGLVGMGFTRSRKKS